MPWFGKRKLTQKKLNKIARLACLQCRQTVYLKYDIDIDPSKLVLPYVCKSRKQPFVLTTLSAPPITSKNQEPWVSVRGDKGDMLLSRSPCIPESQDSEPVSSADEAQTQPSVVVKEPIYENIHNILIIRRILLHPHPKLLPSNHHCLAVTSLSLVNLHLAIPSRKKA